MNRVIKFRAWDKKRKEMLLPERICHLDGETSKGISESAPFLILDQFTGLHDKNGREIYEGDIVSFNEKIVTVVYGGAYEYSAFGITKRRDKGEFGADPTWDTLNPLYAKDCEIVGNIHESPGLVKE